MSEREEHRDYGHDEEAGQKGGAAEAYMASTARPVAEAVDVPIGVARWSSIAAGAVIAFATFIFLNTLGVGFGLALTRAGYGGSLAYWMIASAAVSLFLGSYLAVRSAQVRNLWTGLFYGVVVWSVFLLLDVLGADLFGGISRFFSPVGINTVSRGILRSVTMASGWWFFVGYLIALIASLLGAASGVTVEEAERRVDREERRR